MNIFINVALPLPITNFFTYSIPSELESTCILPGMRVLVPFNNRKIVGFVMNFLEPEAGKNIKNIISILDDEPVIDEKLLKLAEWISSYYFTPIGFTLRYFVPPIKLTKKGLYKKEAFVFQDDTNLKIKDSPLKLTEEQTKCLENIKRNEGRFGVILIHGITGSGKTEIYLQAIASVIKSGKQAIVLVPEIALTPQTISRFKERFGDNLAVLHSRLGAKKREYEWWRIKKGKVGLVIGARSAVFAPVPNPGIIVIDEEHESTYKQEEAPRYHARNVAIMRAKFSDSLVVLGTATPSLESYYNVEKGKYKILALEKRVETSSLPDIEVVDMRDEISKGNLEPFSEILLENMKNCLLKKEQIILFQNRRGFSSFILCRECGKVIKCKNCDVSLTYYLNTKRLRCHYCGFTDMTPSACPSCKSKYLQHFGHGTEKIENNMKKIFPDARIARLDMEITSKKGELEKILKKFQEKQLDILIGTQIIAKGHDFPDVTLVGVIFADITLNLPDFRASERTFQLLTQVAGRAGRGIKKGKVIIQTHEPEHYSIKYARTHDFKNFYIEEMKYRRALSYPPYINIINILFKSKNSEKAYLASLKFSKIFKQMNFSDIKLLGPAPAAIPKINNFNRFQIILKGSNRTSLHNSLLKASEEYFKDKELKSVNILFDVDPLDMI